MTQTQDATVEFSLVRGDALFRMQRALGLIPAHGLGVTRFLLAVPLFIVDDAIAHSMCAEMMPYFARSGLVTDADRPRFVAIVQRANAWRDGWRPRVAIAGIVVAWTASSPVVWDAHELSWAVSDPPLPALRFAVF
jgi:hypothetical protein